MNNPNALTWKVFKEALSGNQNFGLQFQYSTDEWVKPSYHITEIKHVPITSVDCGGKVNRWIEVVIQLWEPEGGSNAEPMKVSKALAIIELVEKAITLDPFAEVKIEFGNSKFDTRQMYPSEIISQGENLIVNLKADMVQCKAAGRKQQCGPADAKEVCCSPKAVEKSLDLEEAAPSACCTTAGCC